MYRSILDQVGVKNAASQAISLVAACVKKTLGPAGNPIIIQQQGTNPDGTLKTPIITKDGVTVARFIALRDPALNTFAQSIIQVAENTVKTVGDGTSSSIVLAEAIYKEGLKHIEQGNNNIKLYNDLNVIKDQMKKQIEEMTRNVDIGSLENVAKISCNGDEEIAKLVVSAINCAGEDGYVSLEESTLKETTLETIEGAVYQTGWKKFSSNGVLLVNNKSKNTCELSQPAVLLYAGKVESVQEVHRLINLVMGFDEEKQYLTRADVPFLIVANDFTDEVKSFILQQKVQAKLNVAAVKAPADGTPNSRTEMLEDLACLLGATVAAKGILDLKDITEEHLGSADRVEIGMNDTVFFDGYGNPDDVLKRIDDINNLIENSGMSEWDLNNLRKRKGKLSNGIAVIKVGGFSELEIKEKLDRIEDALCATRAALKEGVVLGAGMALYKAAMQIEGTDAASEIMKVALQEPAKQIIRNTGNTPELILGMLGDNDLYDSANKLYVKDAHEAGILDPAIVTKSALENAVSIAGLLLTTGGALVLDTVSKDGMDNPFKTLMGG